MVREFGVAANVGKPQVAYRETIRKRVEAEGKFIRQTGGRGQYGHVKITMEPIQPGEALNLKTRSSGARSEGIYRSCRERVTEAMETGVLAGYQSWISKSRCSTVRITKWILRKWHSKSPAPWLSRKRPRKPSPYFWNHDGCRGCCARGIHGRSHGRFAFAQGRSSRHGSATGLDAIIQCKVPFRKCSDTPRFALHDPRPGNIYHAVLSLRGSPKSIQRGSDLEKCVEWYVQVIGLGGIYGKGEI